MMSAAQAAERRLTPAWAGSTSVQAAERGVLATDPRVGGEHRSA